MHIHSQRCNYRPTEAVVDPHGVVRVGMGVTSETNGIGISSFIKYLSSNFKDDPDDMAYLNLANNW